MFSAALDAVAVIVVPDSRFVAAVAGALVDYLYY